MSEQIMSAEEREELNELLDEAAYADGLLVPTRFMAPRAKALLEDAHRAGRPWAEWVLDSALHAGLLVRVKRHIKQENRTELAVTKDLTVDRAAVFGVRRENEEWAQVPLPGMTRDDLAFLIKSADERIENDRRNRQMWRKLDVMLRATGAATVDDGLAQLGQSLEEFLAA